VPASRSRGDSPPGQARRCSFVGGPCEIRSHIVAPGNFGDHRSYHLGGTQSSFKHCLARRRGHDPKEPNVKSMRRTSRPALLQNGQYRDTRQTHFASDQRSSCTSIQAHTKDRTIIADVRRPKGHYTGNADSALLGMDEVQTTVRRLGAGLCQCGQGTPSDQHPTDTGHANQLASAKSRDTTNWTRLRGRYRSTMADHWRIASHSIKQNLLDDRWTNGNVWLRRRCKIRNLLPAIVFPRLRQNQSTESEDAPKDTSTSGTT